jgi:hypothetical protein
MGKRRGWFGESRRHAQAARGIKTSRKQVHHIKTRGVILKKPRRLSEKRFLVNLYIKQAMKSEQLFTEGEQVLLSWIIRIRRRDLRKSVVEELKETGEYKTEGGGLSFGVDGKSILLSSSLPVSNVEDSSELYQARGRLAEDLDRTLMQVLKGEAPVPTGNQESTEAEESV